MQKACGTCPQTRSLSLCNTPPPLHQHHTNTPCITLPPSPPAARQVPQPVAAGPVEQTQHVYPTAEVTGGERLAQWWDGNIEEIEGRGEERREEVASGAFHTSSLITQSFCHAKGRSTSATRNQGISSKECEGLKRIVLCVSWWPFLCKAQICSVQHAATASSAFCCCVSARALPLDPAQTSAWATGQSD